MVESKKANLDDSALSVTLTVGQLKALVREEIEKAAGQNGHQGGDRLLNAKETSALLAMSEDWLYRNGHKLPFVRKMGPRMLRFSYQGIQKWLTSRKMS